MLNPSLSIMRHYLSSLILVQMQCRHSCNMRELDTCVGKLSFSVHQMSLMLKDEILAVIQGFSVHLSQGLRNGQVDEFVKFVRLTHRNCDCFLQRIATTIRHHSKDTDISQSNTQLRKNALVCYQNAAH